MRRAAPAVGARNGAANGSRLIQKLWWKLPTTISRANAFATGRRYFAGVPTRLLASAPWTRSHIAKGNLSPFFKESPRPTRFGDFAHTVEDLVFVACHRVEKIERTAF